MKMIAMKLLIAVIAVLAVTIQEVACDDLEYNITAEMYPDDTPVTTNDDDAINNSSSNYSQCEKDIASIQLPIYSTLTCVSVLTCVVAFLVYASIRKKVFRSCAQLDKDNTKHWIHFNLIISFIFRDVALLIVLFGKPPLRLAAFTFYTYISIANFYWMFNEGLWLYLGVFFANTFRRFKHMKMKTCLVGWLLPGVLTSIWAVAEVICYHRDNKQKWSLLNKDFWEPAFVSCILVPVYLILLVNLIMMIRVLHQIRTMMNGEIKVKRRLVRATFVLSFLLGINFAIPSVIFSLHLSEIEANKCIEDSIELFNYIVSALQGFFVAIFYVLSNKDVLQFFKTHIQEEIPGMSPRVSRALRTSQASVSNGNGLHIRKERPSRISQTSSIYTPPGRPLRISQTSLASQSSLALHVPSGRSLRASQTSDNSQSSANLQVPSPRPLRLSQISTASQSSSALYVPKSPTRSNSDGYCILSKTNEREPEFV